MIKYDAVAFDLDGTLMRSHPGIVKCAAYALDKMGIAHEESTLMKFIGPPLYNSFADFFGMDDKQAVEAIAIYRERFSRVGWRENTVYPGIPRLLRTLKQHGVFVALCSAKPIHFAEKILDYYGLTGLFDAISCNNPNNERHTDDKVDLLRAALPPKFTRAAMVGDRLYDLNAARALSVDGVGVKYGYGSREEIEGCAPTHIADSVDDLYTILLSDTPPARGPFITLEGCEAVGKSTQCKLIKTYLEECGYEVILTREPGGCDISERIREVVLSTANTGMCPETEMLLYAASRAQHVRSVIEPVLSRGAVVLCDRFLDSSLAYQAYGRHLGYDTVMSANAPAVMAAIPDVTILLDMDVSLAAARRNRTQDRIESEAQSFHKRVREGYLEIAQKSGGRVLLLNAQDTKDVIFDKIRLRMQHVLATVRQ